ncbi:MAG: alcohol dehydrogenase catalytic domain-containing protein [Burkholderiaceae bacterium]
MKALQKTAPAFGAELRDVPPPDAPGEGEVIVAVGAACVCGSDLHIYEWMPGYAFMADAMPVTIGHEFAGRIVAAGPGADSLDEGTLVAVRPSVVCGRCDACLRGDSDRCSARRGIGVTRDGAFAAFVRVPAANCIAAPDDMAPEVAALAEPMTVSAEAVATGGVGPGDRVLILGPGNIGQGAALFARAAGAALVVVAGKDDAPRLACLRAMGFDATVDVCERSLGEALAPYLADGKFDVVIEATGVPAIVQPALDVLEVRGVLVICGIHPRPASVDLTRLVRAQQQIRGSYRAPLSTWPRALAFLRDNAKAAHAMITHRLPLDRAIEGFELARSRVASKVVIVP